MRACEYCGSDHIGVKGNLGNRTRFRCHTCGKTWTVLTQNSAIESDKKEPCFNWREWSAHMEERQRLVEKASASQDSATLSLKTPYRCVVLKPLADMHLGDIGTDYGRLEEFTEAVLAIPYLYISLSGDETDNFVSFKSQMPMLAQCMSPAQQDEFLESWLDEIGHKVLFSGWGNHAEFEERVSGRNSIAKILSKNLVYFNGIGVCNFKLNDQSYKIVSTHRTRYNSSFNKTHGLKQLARRDIPDADVYIAGHIHDPSFEVSFERGMEQVFVVLGSLKTNDSFAKRYFSYFSARRDSSLVFDTETHSVMPFASLEQALRFAELANRGVAA